MQNVITLSSHTKKKNPAVQTGLRGQSCLWVFGERHGVGDSLPERGLGFPSLVQSGPWGALKRWLCDPIPRSDSEEQRGSAKGRHHSCKGRGCLASRDLSRRGVGEKKHFQEKCESRGRIQKEGGKKNELMYLRFALGGGNFWLKENGRNVEWGEERGNPSYCCRGT